jgi:hypothetical protein
MQISNIVNTIFLILFNFVSGCIFSQMGYNGLQYNQWRIAGDITVNRYKTLRGADAFKLPLRPTLVILPVAHRSFLTKFSSFLFQLIGFLKI